MTNQLPNSADPPPLGHERARRQGSSWATTLILACLALGFTASAVEYERVRVRSEQERAEWLSTADSSMEGQFEDLGKFLADPQTRLIRLTGLESSPLPSAAIAWNTSEQKGYLLCDQLPALNAGMAYEVWVRRGSDAPIRIAGIQPEAGSSVYLFRATGVKSRDRLEISAGPPSAGKTPILTGEFE
jgi:hypothetical protein